MRPCISGRLKLILHNRDRRIYHHTCVSLGGTLSLRAVIFDYGMVLTGQPDQAAHDAMIRITGLSRDQFEAIYWADRHAYDEGKLTGLEFWRKLNREAKLNLDAATLDEL